MAITELHHKGDPSRTPLDRGLGLEERRSSLKIAHLEYLAGRICVPPNLPLNILVVENDVRALRNWDRKVAVRHCGEPDRGEEGASGCIDRRSLGYLENAVFWVVESGFPEFARKLKEGKERAEDISALRCGREYWHGNKKPTSAPIPWGDLDLVLQDIMLGKESRVPTGLALAPYYVEACPQAMVFLLTGLDVEMLAVAGEIDWRYVDGVISKRRLGSLWWVYWRRFREVLGRMFWPAWVELAGHGDTERQASGPTKTENGSKTVPKGVLRHLFGSMRKWVAEPQILCHGQGVPEMVDHSDRHIHLLWRLVDDVVGVLLENTPRGQKRFTVWDRVLLALAVWLHDVGHRGDEYFSDSSGVRQNHAGIGERLILRGPLTFAVDWLQGLCHVPDCQENANGARLKCRNSRICQDGGPLCPLREVGLLCRHHQSNAPLNLDSLLTNFSKGKAPSCYSRVRGTAAAAGTSAPRQEKGPGSEDDLKAWLSTDEPLDDWCGSDVVTLADFKSDGGADRLLRLTGLLRMMDALQVHRGRVGSRLCINSFKGYLSTRNAWCNEERKRIEKALRETTPTEELYRECVGRRLQLSDYQLLLQTQYVHYWRQAAVHEVRVDWRWTPDLSSGVIRIIYSLDDWGLRLLDEMVAIEVQVADEVLSLSVAEQVQEKVDREVKRNEATAMAKAADVLSKAGLCGPKAGRQRLWALHILDDIVLSEHESQTCVNYAYRQCLGVELELCLGGLASTPLANGPVCFFPLEVRECLTKRDT